MAFNWTCLHCGSHTTLQSANYQNRATDIVLSTAGEGQGIRLKHVVIKCPNVECGKITMDVWADYFQVLNLAHSGKQIPNNAAPIGPVGPGHFRFEPRVGRPLSVHPPVVVKQDYEEACTIRDLSPKAAATLCRRALQGMIRDFWGISKSRLADELKAIEDKCDHDLYAALMSMKGIGNIGAHPERDVNLIVDVESDEVDELIELVRILDKEWYVTRAGRRERLFEHCQTGQGEG